MMKDAEATRRQMRGQIVIVIMVGFSVSHKESCWLKGEREMEGLIVKVEMEWIKPQNGMKEKKASKWERRERETS